MHHKSTTIDLLIAARLGKPRLRQRDDEGKSIKPRPEDDCYMGSPMRSQIYQNVCEPNYGLLRQKIPLNDNCQRTIGGKMSAPRNYYVCEVDKHLQRKCGWIKK